MLIVRDAFLGYSRFEEFQERLGIARNILQQRLAKLLEYEVLQREAYSVHPPRFEYTLTQKGRDLWPVLTAMRQWGDVYAAPGGPPVEMRHLICGEIALGVWTCSSCGAPFGPDDIEVVKNRCPMSSSSLESPTPSVE